MWLYGLILFRLLSNCESDRKKKSHQRRSGAKRLIKKSQNKRAFNRSFKKNFKLPTIQLFLQLVVRQ